MALRKYRKALRYLDVCWEKEEIDEGSPTSFCLHCLFYIARSRYLNAMIHLVSVLSEFMIPHFAEKSSCLRKIKAQIFTNSSVSFLFLFGGLRL